MTSQQMSSAQLTEPVLVVNHPQARLVSPHGGVLVDLLVTPSRAAELRAGSQQWPSWKLSTRQQCDLELLLNGALSPLRGFMTAAEASSVAADMRLPDGTLWPLPIMLDIPRTLADTLAPGGMLALRDVEGTMLAALRIDELWEIDRSGLAEQVLGTLDTTHPGVHLLLNATHEIAVAGRLEGIQLPDHAEFRDLRATPRELRHRFARRGWSRVVAFQTRNPMHRAHFELTRRACVQAEAGLLLHPTVGPTRSGDVDAYARVRSYRALLGHYPPGQVELALLPLAMRMAGPREALWHAIVRLNHGCSHFIVGRDHAGPGRGKDGKPFYGPYDAQELLRRHEAELGIRMVPFEAMVYVEERDAYVPQGEVPSGTAALTISGTEFRERLDRGREIPAWFSFPDVMREIARDRRPRHSRGFTVFFTGLSGAGKSTLAHLLRARLLELGGRHVCLLDGDVVRQHLSSELGFSKRDRDLNVRRIGFVAAEISRAGGIAICAPIAPYDTVRREVRALAEPGGFVLVHVATPLEICERRDRKGLYAKARAGLIAEFTGVSDPYEAPSDAEVIIDTSGLSPDEGVDRVMAHLQKEGFIELPDLPLSGLPACR